LMIFDLPSVERDTRNALPEMRLVQHSIERTVGQVDGLAQHLEEPHRPRCHVQAVFLRSLQDVEIRFALTLDLRRKAVEALRTVVGPRQQRSPMAYAMRPLLSGPSQTHLLHITLRCRSGEQAPPCP
jgi:hypothetical protein